jgi:hypothetical protein
MFDILAIASDLGVATRRNVALGPHLVPEKLKASTASQAHPSGGISKTEGVVRKKPAASSAKTI